LPVRLFQETVSNVAVSGYAPAGVYASNPVIRSAGFSVICFCQWRWKARSNTVSFTRTGFEIRFDSKQTMELPDNGSV